MSTYPMGLQAAALFVPFVDYWTMRDQAGTLWYLWVTKSRDIVCSASIPAEVHRQGALLTLSPIPYWLELSAPDTTVWRVLPILSGEIRTQTGVPSVGTGYSGSPVVRGLDLRSYLLTLNNVGELTATPQ